MFPRHSFWLGLLLGGLASFYSRSYWLHQNQPLPSDPLLDMVGEAVVVCDAEGVITYTNAAAQALLGPNGIGITRLAYPSGQKVPGGQLPLNRAQRTGKEITGAGYILTSEDGTVCALEIAARPLPDGGAAATVRDVTALQEGQIRESTVLTREQILRVLCRRMSAATDAAQLTRVVAESALSLVHPLPNVQVRLYTYDSPSKLITQVASVPEDRTKREQKPLVTIPFDAASPLWWSLYVARQPIAGAEDAAFSYALPLVAGGVALGHLSLTSSASDVFEGEDLHESLALLASVAALALAGPQQAAQSAHLAEQVQALREIVQAVGAQKTQAELADLVSRHVVSILGGEVCTIALRKDGRLCLAGTNYQEALLFPERTAPDDRILCVEASSTVEQIGLPNPRFEDGTWRVFAGQSGKHSVLTVPLGADQGTLTVYVTGETPFPPAQVTFVETVAALLGAANAPATRAKS